MKALIVDHSEPTRKVMGEMLKRLGLEIFEADHGKAALSQLQKHPDIGLLMLDWNIPEMSGIELLEAVNDKRSSDFSPAIVMVTSENEMSKIEKAMTKGADEYIMKPFTEEILTEKLAILGIGGTSHV